MADEGQGRDRREMPCLQLSAVRVCGVCAQHRHDHTHLPSSSNVRDV